MSSTDVKIFEKEEFGSVRVVMQGDDPWFVASDVAKSLGYDNPANAINTHCKKINKITLSPDLGGREISSKMPPVVMNIIPESDVYRLVMRSNLPNAVAFQDWVCEEVLPAIRKTGEYSTTLPDFTNPAEAARAWADEYEKNLALTAANQQLTEEKEMLEIVIGNAREWKAVTAIPWLKHYFIDTSPRTCAAMNFQTKTTNGKWEPIGTGTAYAVMLDTGKLHSDGTPIRQLKWDTGAIPVIQNFLDAEIED